MLYHTMYHTLLVVKQQDFSRVHKLFNNLKFVVDLLEKEVPRFLDLKMLPDRISIYRKDTDTRLYANYTSFVPSTYHNAWISVIVL